MSRQHPWRAEHPDAVIVDQRTKWGNPFAVGGRSGLARVPAIHHADHEWEYEGRISAAGMRHDYYHADGRITVVHVRAMTAAECVECYRALLVGDGRWPIDFTNNGRHYPHVAQARAELAGRDLACSCPLDQPCHADVLLELANGDER
jgi:hypothetical protein